LRPPPPTLSPSTTLFRSCFLELTGGNLARAPATMGEARQPNRLHPSTLTAPLRPRERDGAFRSPDLLPYPERWILRLSRRPCGGDRKSTRLNSSHVSISY